MTSLTNLPPTQPRESSDSSEVSELESQLIGLMISPDMPGREDGLHGSRFIECMDYSITSFEAELCDIRRPSKIIAPSNASVPSPNPSPPTSRRTSRGFGSLIRMLSLKNAPKRDVSPNSTTTKLFQFKPESFSCDLINSSNLSRRLSHKNRRTSTPLVIETERAASWSTGLKCKTFTPFFLVSSSPSPISLSSSTSGFSGESSVTSNPKSKTYVLSETVLGTPRPNRSNSMSQVNHAQSLLPPSSIVDTTTHPNPLPEPSNRFSFSRKSIGSQRRDKIDKSHIPSTSILSKLPQVRKKTTANPPEHLSRSDSSKHDM